MYKTIKSLCFVLLIGVLASSCVTIPPQDTAGQPTMDDILEGMPAQSFEEFNAYGAACVAMGDDAVEDLCEQLVPPGTGDDTAVRYALSGLAKYVSRPGAEKEREMVCEEIAEVLVETDDDEIAAFLMRQLEVAGGNESVAVLASFLDDERLSEPAVLALTSIGTPKAAKALNKALHGKAMNKAMIVKALGTLKYAPARKQIEALAQCDCPNMQKVAMYALSQID